MRTSMSDSARESIDGLRAKIDEIDCRVVEMLNDRAKLALEIRALKPAAKLGLYDPKREEEIFVRLAACNTGPLYGDNLREIYEAILHVMKEL
jgi:chorismate mutase